MKDFYAIVRTGGNQYSVSRGDLIQVELVKASAEKEVILDDILFFFDGKEAHIGQPTLDVRVRSELVDNIKGDKLITMKKKRKKGYKKKIGHRQNYSILRILDIFWTNDQNADSKSSEKEVKSEQ